MSVLLMCWCLPLLFQYIRCMLQWVFEVWLDQLFPTANVFFFFSKIRANGSKWWLQIVILSDICSVKFNLQRTHCCSRLRSFNLFSQTLREKPVLPKLHLIVSLILTLNPSSVVSYVENDLKIVLHTTFISICWKYRCNVETKWTCT